MHPSPSSLNPPPLICPQCRGTLLAAADGYRCQSCARRYPLHGGIPDFRLFADPYLDWDEDRQRTDFVLSALPRFDLPGLLEHYWSVSDVTPEVLRGKFIRSVMLGEHKARRILGLLQDNAAGQPVRTERVLEIGSGTGNFLAVAVPRCRQLVGLDIAMRWLHVSRRRFLDKGTATPTLICGCAEHLPFPDNYFDLIVVNATLEFAREPSRLLAECARVLRADGTVYISTVNRFSIAHDPYVYLWGVGFLPRRWQARYVRWRRQASYENIRLLSLWELRRLGTAYFSAFEAQLPDIDNESLRHFPLVKRIQVWVYRTLKRIPWLNYPLLWVAPQWDIRLGRPLKS